MPDPQFDAKVTSRDGKMLLFIRGPFEQAGGIGFEVRMVPVVEMADWPVMWKEGRDEQADNTQ